MDLHLQGKTALITGGSKGIGKAIAARLAAEGCDLHLAARNATDLETCAADLRAKYKVTVTIHPLDLSLGDKATELVASCGPVDILVNNAGAIAAGSINDIDEASWRSGWDLKVYGFVNLARAMYRVMKARGHGVVLNVIGIAGGEVTEFNYIAGTTGNAGLAAFTRAMGGGSPADNIRVLGINPGMTATQRLVDLMRQNASNKGLDPDDWRQLTTTMPFGRLAEPAEVADLCAFLVSDRAAYISGTVVTIDGGLSSRGHLFG
ncbi:MAG: SDR family oxidoreductase [Gammaproteobacteria bacterium]|nr:SDR family oxidoreductase [Gammaproteobacteria bacterium]MBQ0841038.1 SDR family oxidoreductase [Gammaproteobacteria bacterium]